MAHIEKYKTSSVRKLLRHDCRELADYNPSRIKSEIDPDRSKDNYSLLERANPYEYFKERKAELYCYGRADVKTMVGVIITAPKGLDETKHKEFFSECVKFLNNRYGEVNAISAMVHMDETSPHLHFRFIPAVADNKHGGEKICAKEILTKKHLQEFHPDLQNHITAAGLNAKIINGATEAQGGNRQPHEYKQEQLQNLKLNIRDGRDRAELEQGVFIR